MNKPKIIFSKTVLAAALLIGACVSGSFAQTPAKEQKQAEPNYEVVLQVLTASNNASDKSAGDEAVPPTLSNAVGKLRAMYSFSNYRLNLTYVQRVANTGNIEFKGVENSANQDAFAPVFSNFSIGNFQILPDAKGQSSVSITNFRFGQRVPIKTATIAGESGKSNSVITYEQIGLQARQIGLPLNAPTIIGNLSATRPGELMFLILTVRPADE